MGVCADVTELAITTDIAAKILVWAFFIVSRSNILRDSRLIGYGREYAPLTIDLSNMVGKPHGSECRPHVCWGRPGGQPLGGSDSSRNSPSNAKPSDARPGAATQSAIAGAFRTRCKTYRHWIAALRARQPRYRGAAGGRGSRGERPSPPEG